MADDIAALGISIDSRQVKTADKELNKLASTAKRTQKATDGLNKSTATATSALTAQGTAAKGTARATDSLTAAQTRNTKSTKSMTVAIKAAVAAIAALAALRAIAALKNLSDEATNIDNRLRQVTNSTGELNARFDDLIGVANRTRSSLSSTATLFQRLTLASKDLNISTAETVRLTETINKSFAISGATVTETAGAVRQLSQGLAAGALRGDEFNSVAEQAPAIMDAIARHTGLARGELREFAAEGGITAQIVVESLQAMEEEIDERFGRSTATFSQQMEIINNDLIEWARNNEDLTIVMSATGVVIREIVELLIIFADIVIKAASGIVQLAGFFVELASNIGVLTGAWDELNRPVSEFLSLDELILESIGFINTALLRLVEVAITPTVFGLKALRQAAFNTFDFFVEGAALVAEFTGASEETVANIRAMQINFESLASQMNSFYTEFDIAAESIANVTFNMIEHAKATEAATVEISEQRKAELKALAAKQKLIATQKRLKKATEDVVKEIKEEIDALARDARAQALYEALKEAGVDANSEFAESIREVNDVLFDQIDLMDRVKEKTKELEKANDIAAKLAAKQWLKTRDTLADAFVDMFDNGKSAFDDILDGFKDLIKRMIATAAANKILLSLGITGGSIAAGAAGQGAGGLISSILGGGGGGLGSINTQLLTSAGVTLAAGFVGAKVGDKLGEAIFNKQAESNIGATVGAIGGAFLGGPIGAAIGGAIGGALDVAFGGDANKRTTLGVNTFAGSQVSDVAFRQERAASGLLLTAQEKRTGEQGRSAASDLLDAFLAIDATATSIARSFGQTVSLSGTSLSGKSSEFGDEAAANRGFFGSAAFNEVSAEQVTGSAGAFTSELADAIGGEFDQLFDKVTQGLSDADIAGNIDSILAEVNALGHATEIAAEAAAMAAAAAEIARDAAVDAAFSALQGAISSQKQLVATELAAVIDAADAELRVKQDALRADFERASAGVASSISTVTNSVKDLNAVSNALRNTLRRLRLDSRGVDLSRRRGAQADITASLATARAGGAVDADVLKSALDEVARPSADLFSTFTDYARDFALTANDIGDLSSITDTELTLQERTLDALKARKEQIGVQFQQDQDQAQALHDAEIERMQLIADTEIEKLDRIELDFQTLIEVSRGTTQATLSVAAAISSLSSLVGDPVPGFANGGSFGGGARIIGETGPELEITGRSQIVSNSDLSAAMSGGNLLPALDRLVEVISQGNFAIARNTSKTAKQLDRWDQDGMPPVREAI